MNEIKAEFVALGDDGTLQVHVDMKEYDRIKGNEMFLCEVEDKETSYTVVGIDKKERKLVTNGYLIPREGRFLVVGIESKETTPTNMAGTPIGPTTKEE